MFTQSLTSNGYVRHNTKINNQLWTKDKELEGRPQKMFHLEAGTGCGLIYIAEKG